MRWRRALVVGLSAISVAAACSRTGATPGDSQTAASAAVTPVRGAGGDLRILYWQAPTILNPHLATGSKDIDPARLVLEPLASWDADGKPLANGLAAQIPTIANGGVSKDLTTVTWTLRGGVKWSDGTEFSADDVVFTYEYVKGLKNRSESSSHSIAGVRSVVAKDPLTVVVTYERPTPFYYQWGVGSPSVIIQRAQFGAFTGEKVKDAPGNLKPIGTGPYKVVDFRPGDRVTYELNERFRDPNKPFFKTVSWKGGGDAVGAARAVFQTGDVDYAWSLAFGGADPVLKQMVQTSTTGDLLTVYGPVVEHVLINFANPDPALGERRGEPGTTHPFLTDVAVRRALAMATDRTAVGDLYGPGLTGKATCNILTAPMAVVSTNTSVLDVCRFDLAAANAELDKAGYVRGPDGVRSKNGVRLELTFQTTVVPVRQQTQNILKANWEKVGFKVTLKAVPASTYFTNTSPESANHFWADLEMYSSDGDPDPTSYIREQWGTAEAASKANAWNGTNYARYSNAELDRTIADLATETDEVKRNSLFIAANDHLVRNVVVIPLVQRAFPISGKAKALKGVKPTAGGWDSEMYNVADWTK